ncbi:Peptide-methionine (S)-S-oxide reductase [Serendipita sp. 411]|nr:Peptide-methionine (S)-S-oxide reductase [Serendipita sp. 411]
MSDDSGNENIATFAAGCFWGVEHIFNKYFPDLKTSVGYSNGKENISNPSYRQVCSGTTEYAEAVRIEFDPAKTTYAQLVEHFYRTHDPTTVNRQGNDTGTQYRSGIYTHTDEQEKIAKEVTERIQEKYFAPKGLTITTEIIPAGTWYNAEEYHQKYLDNNPDGYQCPTHRLHW